MVRFTPHNTLFTIALFLWSLVIPVQAEITFRGAWVATVAHIDWPRQEAVDNDSLQQVQMVTLLDSLHAIGINAIVFQIRPTADALYWSELEPLSHWLTGQQGRSNSYDPLSLVVQECHKRGMEVHAWLNPYRVTNAQMDTSMLSSSHLLRQHPDWFWHYAGQWYFNPAMQETRDWLCRVVNDIVCRYRVDAIHMDDYFYPYPVGKQPLPDIADYQRDPRGFATIEDWRRDNVNRTIQALSATIHRARPDVQFGISPFGIYRSDGATLSNYNDLYADVLYWIEQGWIDYVVPQLYWSIGSDKTDYATLARWWAQAVNGRCRLYIGMAPYKLGNKGVWSQGNEIVRQMRLNREIEGISGECFYSTRPLLRNPLHVCDSIRSIYKY